MTKLNATQKLGTIQQVVCFHQEELLDISKSLSLQSETVVSLKNVISSLKSKLESKNEETQSMFRVDISKFSDQISRKCSLQSAILGALSKLLTKLSQDSVRARQGISRMESKLRQLEGTIGT